MSPGEGMAADSAARRGPSPALVIAGLTVLALAIRFYKLGDWNFEATEMFTLRDSLRPRWTNSRPLGYLLNHYLVGTFRPLDELGLRLLPALFGVLAVPAMYLVGRRVTGTRAALFSALLLTFSALHVFYSQFARYWSLVFLLCLIYTSAFYLAVRERSRVALAVGIVSVILAVLAHPVSILLVGGPAIWLALRYLRPHYLRQAWAYRSFRWGAVLAAGLGAVLIAWVVPLFRGWIAMHDQNPGMGQFLLGPKKGPVVKQVVLLTAYVESLTLPVVLAGLLGIYMLWRERDRTLAIFLFSVAVFPLAFIALVSARTPVSTFYLLPAAPAFFLGAGVFVDRLFGVEWNLRPRWLVPAALLLIIIVAGLPTLASQYRNGRRFDFRGAAQWIEPQLTQGDIIYSDQPMVLDHYMSGPEVKKLRANPAPLAEALAEVGRSGGEALWVVAPAPAHAFRTNLRPGGLADWLYTNCQMRNTFGRGRLDFRQQYLQVYRCPPGGVAASGTSAG